MLTFYYLDNIFTQSDVYYWEELTGIEMILILKDSSFQDVDVSWKSLVPTTVLFKYSADFHKYAL